MNSEIKKEIVPLPPAWKNWIITDLIGKGSYGSVYRACCCSADDNDAEQDAAIKIIEIPADENEAAVIASDHPDRADQIAYYESIVSALLEEINTMERLKDNPNAITLYDYHVSHEEELKWIIYIRMELLTPFFEYQIYHEMDEKNVIRLGIDICNVLDECSRVGIIHRDIKLENIMVDDEGRYKLGDFGIARKLKDTTNSYSLKGTFTYMAPEVYRGRKYDVRVDQYSLGIVLYRLMNNNRDPLTDPDLQIVSYKEREEALKKRMEGEVLPNPVQASESFARIIRKACSYRPENRFENISEMKQALERCYKGEVFEITNLVEVSEEERLQLIRQKKRKKRTITMSLLIAGLGIIIGVVVFILTREPEQNSVSEPDIETGEAENKNEILKNEIETPENGGGETENETGETENETGEADAQIDESETDAEIIKDESREIENYIENNGVRKDNGMLETDITGAAAYQDEIDLQEDAAEVMALLEKDENTAKERNDDGRQNYEKCALCLVYLDDSNACGMSINYNSEIDNATNTEKVYPLYSYFYYKKINDNWELDPDNMIPAEVQETIYEKYMPQGFMEAYQTGRNWCFHRECFWVGTGAVYDRNLIIEFGAAWQNADGSVDVYALCRNGTDRLSAEYNYWVLLGDGDKDVVAGYGNLDADKVVLEKETVKAYMIHFEPDEVLTGNDSWSDGGIWSFIAGYNSNYITDDTADAE